MLRVGLTGGVASGKSTAGKFFAELGAAVFDADRIVAELYAPNRAGSRAVSELFGAEYLQAGGEVDKARLAREIFSVPAARKRLEAAIHPLVVAEIRRRFAAAETRGSAIAVAEASQIFEGGYEGEFDRVVLVIAPEIARMKRWREKGLDPEELTRRMAAQVVENEAHKKADDVIVNAGTLEDLRKKVDELHSAWRRNERGSA